MPEAELNLLIGFLCGVALSELLKVKLAARAAAAAAVLVIGFALFGATAGPVEFFQGLLTRVLTLMDQHIWAGLLQGKLAHATVAGLTDGGK